MAFFYFVPYKNQSVLGQSILSDSCQLKQTREEGISTYIHDFATFMKERKKISRCVNSIKPAFSLPRMSHNLVANTIYREESGIARQFLQHNRKPYVLSPAIPKYLNPKPNTS